MWAIVSVLLGTQSTEAQVGRNLVFQQDAIFADNCGQFCIQFSKYMQKNLLYEQNSLKISHPDEILDSGVSASLLLC